MELLRNAIFASTIMHAQKVALARLKKLPLYLYYQQNAKWEC